MAITRLPPASISPGSLAGASLEAPLSAAAVAAVVPAGASVVAGALLPPPQPVTIPAAIAVTRTIDNIFFVHLIMLNPPYY